MKRMVEMHVVVLIYIIIYAPCYNRIKINATTNCLYNNKVRKIVKVELYKEVIF
jgi:hypothetical protein